MRTKPLIISYNELIATLFYRVPMRTHEKNPLHYNNRQKVYVIFPKMGRILYKQYNYNIFYWPPNIPIETIKSRDFMTKEKAQIVGMK